VGHDQAEKYALKFASCLREPSDIVSSRLFCSRPQIS
jgi:hypothetical protein